VEFLVEFKEEFLEVLVKEEVLLEELEFLEVVVQFLGEE
jgi:hypothetical protein